MSRLANTLFVALAVVLAIGGYFLYRSFDAEKQFVAWRSGQDATSIQCHVGDNTFSDSINASIRISGRNMRMDWSQFGAAGNGVFHAVSDGTLVYVWGDGIRDGQVVTLQEYVAGDTLSAKDLEGIDCQPWLFPDAEIFKVTKDVIFDIE